MKNKTGTRMSSNIILLGLVSLINDFSSEMIMPILPMFITALGGGGIAVGLVGGIRDSFSSFLKIIFGYWSDRTGKRKVFVFSGYFTSAFFKLLLVFSRIWQHIMVFSSLERLGKGLRSAPRDAIISDSLPEHKGKGFGVHQAMDTFGAILGSAMVFVLFWYLGLNFKSIILIAAILSFFSLIPLYFVKEQKKEPQKISLKIGLKNLPASCKRFILIAAIFDLAKFNYMFFVLKAQTAFPGKASVGIPILLYILFNVFYAAFAVPFGILSDKIGRQKVIIAGYLVFSVTSFGFAVFNSLVPFIFLFILYGLVVAMVDGNQRAFVSDLSSEKLRATALGTFHTIIGLVELPASLIAGFLWQRVAPGAPFIYGGALSIVPVILFLILGKRLKD